MRKIISPASPRYPALVAWRKRVGDTPSSRWAFDNLWRAAMAEIDASAAKDNSHREQQYQREAIAVLLGEPLHRVGLTWEIMRRYVKAIATHEQKAAA